MFSNPPCAHLQPASGRLEYGYPPPPGEARLRQLDHPVDLVQEVPTTHEDLHGDLLGLHAHAGGQAGVEKKPTFFLTFGEVLFFQARMCTRAGNS